MRSLLCALSVFFISSGAICAAASPPVELELATERGVQITAPQEWLQLLAGIGIENVRIRGAKASDVPSATNRGTATRPSFQVVGILTAGNQLRLAGGTFGRGDRAAIKDYFDRLTADGAEALTAPRGMFGLTDNEITTVFDDLGQPIVNTTKGKPARAVTDELQRRFNSRVLFDPAAEKALHAAENVPEELQGMTAGTGLAILLRMNGLVFRPEKTRGEPVVYRVSPIDLPANRASSDIKTILALEKAGRTDDVSLPHWPIGWTLHGTPVRSAPSLFEQLNVEIDGFTLDETLAAIAPRIKVPIYVDQLTLRAHGIDTAKVQVRIPKTRTSYKRLIDRSLSQARIGSEIRIDEAGRAFLWITR